MSTETLRPNAAGDECNIGQEIGAACPNHYQNVDEAVADDDTTKVQTTNATYQLDLYNTEDHSVGSGTINHITVYARCKSGTHATEQTGLKIACKSGTTTAYGSEEQLVADTWNLYSKQWTTNPDDSAAWEWADIDALQIGISLREGYTGVGGASHCTQVYVVVDYTPPVTHEGAATLSGVGTLAGIGRGIFIGKATLSGLGTLAAIGYIFKYGVASLSGAGSLVAKGVRIFTGKSTLSGVGTLIAKGVGIFIGKATLSGTGTLAIIGVITAIGKAALSGVGTLAAKGVRIFTGKAILTGAGTLAAIGQSIVHGIAALSGLGTLIAKLTGIARTCPTVKVRIAFASDPLATTPTWTDVSADVMELWTRRGRQHELDRIEAGEALVVLNNANGDYWPDNAGGSYYPNILPAKRINIRAISAGDTYDIFTGFIESWKPGWLGKSGTGAIMTLQCADLFKILARFLLNNAGYAEQRSDERATEILDDLGWPAGDRSLATGQTTLQATGALSNENALSHLHNVQWSELGLLWQAGDGTVTFKDRHDRLVNHNSSLATFGDDTGEQHYFDIEFSHDDEFIYNDVRIEREGGTEQTASDATSKGDYGQRGLSRTGLLMTQDSEAQDQADYLLSRYKDAAQRVRSIKILPGRAPASLYPKVLSYDISSRITIRLNAAHVDGDYHIEGIEHRVKANERLWQTKWQLSKASSQQYWAIGVAGFSEIGETTKLCY